MLPEMAIIFHFINAESQKEDREIAINGFESVSQTILPGEATWLVF
jgi:hypothetical protein